MTTAIPYKGSKSRIADWVVEHLPTHGHYVDVCGGGLSVLMAKPRSRLETVNDADGDLVHLWATIRDQPDELARLLHLTPHSRAEYYQAHTDPADGLERARRTYIRLSQGTTQTTVHGGMWARYIAPTGRPVAAQVRAYVSRIAAMAERLADVSLDCRDALGMVTRYGRHPDVLLYVDPPYPGTAARYAHDVDHAALLDALTSCRARVAVSGYPGTVYEETLADWQRHETQTVTGGRHAVAAPRTEVLWVRPC